MTAPIAVVGAGFSGAVVARQLALAGFTVRLFDARNHIAGNVHTERDDETGIMVHAYGPHIFHTDDLKIWQYLEQFDRMMPFINRVKAIAKGKVFSLPINLMTINQLFGSCYSPQEAVVFLRELGDSTIVDPQNFEEQALRFLGRSLYETFFRGYTRKQWGVDPTQLPASILKRLPVRFSYDDNYYNSRFQGIPEHGYSHIIAGILRHPAITVDLGTHFHRSMREQFSHVFFSGPLDEWFDRVDGGLRYRTLDFQCERHHGDFQGNAVINYCDEEVPWTRIAEHKHFTPWESHVDTVIYREFSRDGRPEDIPYYPVRLIDDKERLVRYAERASAEQGVTFLGRLGTYRYLDMDVTIAEALQSAEQFIACRRQGTPPPPFSVHPIVAAPV